MITYISFQLHFTNLSFGLLFRFIRASALASTLENDIKKNPRHDLSGAPNAFDCDNTVQDDLEQDSRLK
jgi:hypothetical protein